MIIDIHAHVHANAVNRDIEEQSLLDDMDRNGIDLRVISALDTWDASEGNKFVSNLVSRMPGRLMGCAVANPKDPDCASKIAQDLCLPGMAMLEMNSFEHGYYPDVCPGVERVLDVAEKMSIPVKVFTGIGCRSMPQQWMKHVRNHPSIPFIFLHMGCFDYGYGCIDLVNRTENLYIETSNQYEVQILKKACRSAPRDRILFGSMWPDRLTRCSLDVFDTLSPDDSFLQMLHGENAAKLLGIGTVESHCSSPANR